MVVAIPSATITNVGQHTMVRGLHPGNSMITKVATSLFGALAAIVALNSRPASAKRAVPADVPPLVFQGIRYEAPHFSNPCGQNGGCLVAYDHMTGVQLWAVKVYCTRYDSGLETDVQDVFITSLALGDNSILVTNERNHHFSVDQRTRKVSGDLDGCEHGLPGADVDGGGCMYSPNRSVPVAAAGPISVLLALLVFSRRRA
jgi:hypothetical protein